MKINLKKTLLISGAVLSILMMGNVVTNQHRLNFGATRVEARAVTMYHHGYDRGYRNGHTFYNDDAVNMSKGEYSSYIFARLANQPLLNKKFKRGYIKGYNKYAGKKSVNNTHKTNNQEYPGYKMTSSQYQRSVKIYKRYRHESHAFLEGRIDRVYNGMFPDVKVPVKYWHSMNYAKGYMGSNRKISSPKMLNNADYEDYHDAGGKVPLRKLLNHHYQVLYQDFWKIIKYEVHNALSLRQSNQYTQKFIENHHFSKEDKAAFNMFNDMTIDNMGYNDFGGGWGPGNYLWKGKGFAINEIRKAPFHKMVHFNKWAIDYSSIMNKKSNGDGVIVGLKNNNTKAARRTAKVLVKYIHASYNLNHANKPFIRKFKRNYKITTIAKAKEISGSRTDYMKGISIYHVSNRHAKRSTVAYYIPDGKGPLGWVPIPND